MFTFQFIGTHQPKQSEGDENESQLSKQCIVLSRKPAQGQEDITPSQLVFTTESIDNR